MPSPSLELRLLGRFTAFVDGKEVDEKLWVRRKAKTLIKLLALVPRRQMHREQLIELLWPDADVEQGLNNLHKIVHAARRAFEPSLPAGAPARFLFSEDTQISLASAAIVQIDIEEFEALSAVALRTGELGQLEAAHLLYPGGNSSPKTAMKIGSRFAANNFGYCISAFWISWPTLTLPRATKNAPFPFSIRSSRKCR